MNSESEFHPIVRNGTSTDRKGKEGGYDEINDTIMRMRRTSMY